MKYEGVLPIERLQLNIKIGLALFILSMFSYFYFHYFNDDIYIFLLSWTLFFCSAFIGGLNTLALYYRQRNLPIPEEKNDFSESWAKGIYFFAQIIIMILGVFIPIILKVYWI